MFNNPRKINGIIGGLIVSLIALGIVVFIINVPSEYRMAGKQRSKAQSTLLSANGKLRDIALYVEMPLQKNGSISHLNHYLSKNAGRRKFIRQADQRRAEAYLAPLEEIISTYKHKNIGIDDDWLTEYVAIISILFEQVIKDAFTITGFPEKLTFLRTVRNPEMESAIDKLEKAVEQFGEQWIPRGETISIYRPDKRQIRNYLLGNWRFKNGMKKIDKAWENLIGELYSLLKNQNWQIACSLDPSLQRKLDEVIMILHSSDIYRADTNLLANVSNSIPHLTNSTSEYELRWETPLSFYKNIPELTGPIQDAELIMFFVGMSIGYTLHDTRIQTWLNQHKDWLSEYFRMVFSSMSYQDFYPQGILAEWQFAKMKAEAIYPVNQKIIFAYQSERKKIIGIRKIAITKVNLIEANQ